MESIKPRAYYPLEGYGAIRLLILGPGAGDDPISCTMLHTVLSSYMEITYQALSYEWGKPEENEPVILMDGEPVSVRVNLWEALWQIRKPDEDLALWIDALCIDQANVHERNAQVQLMGNIYRQAECVIAWLGPSRDGSDLAMQAMAGHKGLKTRIKSDEVDISEREALVALCNRPYWRRVWILQELFLAQRYVLRCGSKSLSEKQFLKFIVLMRTHSALHTLCSQVEKSPAHAQRLARDLRHEDSAGPNTLRRWLRLCIDDAFESSEPRDQVYALLSISSDCSTGQIKPDYAKPLLDVYLEAVDKCKASRFSITEPASFASRLATKMGLEAEVLEMKRSISAEWADREQRESVTLKRLPQGSYSRSRDN